MSDGKTNGRPEQVSVEILRQTIDRVRDIELVESSVDELKELLVPLFTGWKVKVPVFEPGLDLFRGRLLQEGPPENISEMSYPPIAFCPLGRANRPGQPIQYCSAGRNAIFFETGAAEGNRLALVHYKTSSRLTVNRIGFTDETFARLASARAVPDYGALHTQDYTDGDRLVNDFLSEVFCEMVPPEEEWRYKLSVAIAEKLLSADFLRGLMYPTIPMWGNADNFALKPSFVDESLEPVFAEYVEVTKVELPSMRFEVLDEARRFDLDGTIRWLGHRGTWRLENQGDELRFEAVNGRWIARNKLGQIVDPE